MLVGSGGEVSLKLVTSLDEVAGEMDCPDCYPLGSGFFLEPVGTRLPCLTFKGSKKVLVSL